MVHRQSRKRRIQDYIRLLNADDSVRFYILMYPQKLDNAPKSYFYPVQWRELAREIKEANFYICQACHKQCRRPGEMWLGWEYEMAIAHICQNYEAEAVCVAALCGRCHFAMDAPLVWVSRRRHERFRRWLAGQLTFALNAP